MLDLLGSDFMPLMTLYLTDQTSVADIRAAVESGVSAVKLYPAGATTNSDAAVTGLTPLYPVFEEMAELGMPLLIHGEVTDLQTDIFDREKQFIDEHLAPLTQAVLWLENSVRTHYDSRCCRFCIEL